MPLEDYKKMKLHKKSYKLGISPYEYRTHKVREKAHRNDMRYGEYIESRMREEANRQNISVDNLKRKIMDDEEMNMSSSDIEVHSENEHILGYESISDSSTSSSGEESDVPNEEEH
jgi:hypothetical protein